MPTASSPRSTMRCSATAESTPPDMATAVRLPERRRRQARDRIGDGLGERVERDRGTRVTLARDLALGRRSARGRARRPRAAIRPPPARRTTRPRRSRRCSRARCSGPPRSVRRRRAGAGCGHGRRTPSHRPRRRRRVARAGPSGRDPRAPSLMRARRRRRLQRGRDGRDRGGERRAVLGVVALPERAAERAERERPPHSHGGERAARLAVAAVAGRPGGDREALVVEQRAERVPAHAGDQREAVAGEARNVARGDPDVGQRGAQAGLVRVPVGRGWSRRSRCRRRVASSAAASPAACATLSVPGRSPRSCPPPCSTVASVARPRPASTPAPLGPCSLWPEIAAVSSPGSSSRRRGSQAEACTASRCRGTPALGAELGDLAHGLDHAGQVARPDHGAEAVAGSQRARRAQRDRPRPARRRERRRPRRLPPRALPRRPGARAAS